MVKLMFIMFSCWWKIKRMYLKQLCSFTNFIAQVTLCRSGRSRTLRSEISWRTARSAHEVVSTSYWHPGSPHGRERIGSDREASTTVLNCKTLSCWSWLQPPSGIRSDHVWRGRVHARGNRGLVVPGVWAVVDSVWVVAKIVWVVVKIASI